MSGERPWPLFIYGGPGVGKTCAALYLADRVHGRCIFTEFGDLCLELQDAKMGHLIWQGSHADTKVCPADYWSDWSEAVICIVDEIGTRDRITDHQYETFKTAVDRRYGLPLVLISNMDLDGIAQLFDKRVASRCGAGTVVHVTGRDLRLVRA